MSGSGGDAAGWERSFWLLFDRSSDAMSIIDSERGRLAVNAALCDYLQRPREELVGRPLDEVVSAAARPRLQVAWNRLMSVGSWSDEIENVRADGVLLNTHYAARKMELAGEPCYLMVIVAGEPAHHLPPSDAEALTPREQSIVHLLTQGLSSGEIAERLSISRETVRTHIRNAMHKTGFKTRVQLVAAALTDPDPIDV